MATPLETGPGRETARADVDELVFECLEELERSGALALRRLCRAHPERAILLRARLRILRELGLLGHDAISAVKSRA
jgi:hypothetical protein